MVYICTVDFVDILDVKLYRFELKPAKCGTGLVTTMANLGLTLVFTLFFSTTFFSQQLIINEVSQGTGSSEYVEFVVIGNATCVTPVPCIDLRKVIIDDNNGYFAPGSGTGIAAGAIRFADIPFWSCIPQGTYIVVYNESSPNTALPPDDLSLTDGNCRLVLPASSTLFEITTVNSPSTTTNLYPPNASWATGGSWAPLAMSNSNDSFQIPNLGVNGTPLHSVSWGNNTTGDIIYFSGSANLKVFSFVNTLSNDWNSQSNWVAGDVGVNETPGTANSPENDAWIATMNPQCGIPLPISLASNVINESCDGMCDGSVDIIVTSMENQYTFLWQTGETTQSISNLCPGTYNVVVTGSSSCPGNGTGLTVTVGTGLATGDASITPVASMTINDSPIQLVGATSGGSWTSDCGSCLSVSGSFDPAASGVGTFQACYHVGTGICTVNDCISITVIQGCTPQTTSESKTICDGDSVLIFSSWIKFEGDYSQTFTGFNGCDSTHIVSVQFFSVNDVVETITLCENDSIQLFGTWISQTGTYTFPQQNLNGCFYDHIITFSDENCPVEPMVVYIPNAFTPDEDGVNDLFKIELIGGIVESGYVFNRWGEQIATFNSNKLTWDGKNTKGNPVQDGVYTYIVNLYSNSEIRTQERGFIAVIR